MKSPWVVAASFIALTAFTGVHVALAQDRGQRQDDQNRRHDSNDSQTQARFGEKDRQAVTDWYSQHKDHPPAGFRSEDRLTPEQESRMHEGSTLEPDLRGKVHNIPSDLKRRLPPPPRGHRYVAIGGHVGEIDRNYQVQNVIHLHDDR